MNMASHVGVSINTHPNRSHAAKHSPQDSPHFAFCLGMANFRNPNVIERDYLAFIKVCHVVAGLYIWEFFTTLDYEWSVFRGRRPYRWTIWIYLVTRLATLTSVIVDLVGLNIMTPTNCQVLMAFSFTLANVAFALSSLLIVLRIFAIWNWNKAIVGLATVLWTTNASLLILGITRIRSVWVPGNNSCSLPRVESCTPTLFSVLVTDIVLLLIMLAGLLRLRRRDGRMFKLGHLLWTQFRPRGRQLVLACHHCRGPANDLNDPLNDMFLMPSLIIISIAATRMYRSLVDFISSGDIAKDPERPQRIVRNDANAMLTRTISISPDRMEVVVHMAREQHPTSHTGQYASDITLDANGQLSEKPHAPSLDEDLESNLGSH